MVRVVCQHGFAMIRTITLAIALALIGCVTTAPTPTASTVTLVRETSMVAGCQVLGQIHGNSVLTGVAQAQGYENMMTDMKNQAAARGGTHVLLLDVSSGYASNNALGQVYRCGS